MTTAARRSRSQGWPARDVQWHVPGRKTPIAYSTRATSTVIGLLAEGGHTFAEAFGQIHYDPEARAILAEYVRRGHGDVKMIDMGVRYV